MMMKYSQLLNSKEKFEGKTPIDHHITAWKSNKTISNHTHIQQK